MRTRGHKVLSRCITWGKRHGARLLAPFVLAILSSAVPTSARTLTVGAGLELETITAALEEAEDGDRVEVQPGTYRENLVIEKSVELLGTGEPHIIGDGTGDVVVAMAHGVVLSGFAISGSGNRMIHSQAGIKVYGNDTRITENRIFDNLFGVYLHGCEGALIENNTITGRPEVDMGRRGAGIHFYDASQNVIRGNRVSFVRDGTYFDHADFNVVEKNEFSDLRYGVHYMYCNDNSFFGNVFRNSVGGVAIMYTERVTFIDNQILSNRQGYHAFGLLLKEALDSVAERNVILNNGSGIFLDGSHRNHFRQNLVAYNDVGVVLYASSLENTFSANDFIGNLATVHTVGRARANWTPDGQGNYFSDYSGYDLDEDGRGEIPHRLQDAFEYLEGNHPLLRLFLSSAAADALSVAEAAFPIIPSSSLQDHAPAVRPVSGARIRPAEWYSSQPQDSLLVILGWLAVTLASAVFSWRFRV